MSPNTLRHVPRLFRILLLSIGLTFPVLSASAQNAEKIPQNPRYYQTSERFSPEIQQVALSPDGKILAMAGGNSEETRIPWIRLMDFTSGEVFSTLNDNQTYVSTLLFSPDGSELLTQDQDGGTFVFETATGKRLQQLIAAQPGSGSNGECKAPFFLAWSPDGKSLLSGRDEFSAPQEVKDFQIWDVASGKARPLKPLPTAWCEAAWSANGHITTVERKKAGLQISVVDTQGHQLSQHSLENKQFEGLSPDGKWLLCSNLPAPEPPTVITRFRALRAVELWDLETFQKAANWTDYLYATKFTPDGKTLVTCDRTGNLTLRDLMPDEPGKVSQQLPPYAGGELDSWTVSAGASHIATFDQNSARVRLWDLAQPLTPLYYKLDAMLESPNGVSITPIEQDAFISAYAMGRIRDTQKNLIEAQQWNAGLLKRWQIPFENEYAYPTLMKISPDGKTLMAYWPYGPNLVESYDLVQKKRLGSWKLKSDLYGLTFDNQTQNSLIATRDGQVELRDKQGKTLKSWSVATTSLDSIALSPDGSQLAVRADGVITLWNARTGAELKTLAIKTDATLDLPGPLEWSPDGKTLAWVRAKVKGGQEKYFLQLFDVVNNRALREWPLAHISETIHFSPDGTILGIDDVLQRKLFFYRVSDGKPVPAPNDGCNVFNFAWSQDGKHLATDTGKITKIWQWAPA